MTLSSGSYHNSSNKKKVKKKQKQTSIYTVFHYRFKLDQEITDGVDTSKSCRVSFSDPSASWIPQKQDKHGGSFSYHFFHFSFFHYGKFAM